MHMRSARRLVALLPLVLWFVACSSGGSDTPNVGGPTAPPPVAPPPGPPTVGVTLGDLGAEVGYRQSNGNGQVIVIEDPTIGDIALARIENGQRVIRTNPIAFASAHPAFQAFILAHEFGHHYLEHPEQYSMSNPFIEHEADAYATRVAFALGATLADIQLVANTFRAQVGAPATHPQGPVRARYIEDVWSAVQQSTSLVPPNPAGSLAPPTTPVPPPTNGILAVTNPVGEPTTLFVNGIAVAILDVFQRVEIPIVPGVYEVALFGAVSGLNYGVVVVSIGPGQLIEL